MEAGKNGLFDMKIVEQSGLPIFNILLDEQMSIPIVFCTYTDLKKYGFKLSIKQRETMIRGFVRTSNRMKGYAALYDLCEVIEIFCGYSPIYIHSH
ncbi:hypothetical protein BK749_01605 [Bacillus thuringiensis serovar vazensis]|uniref:Uncharacterized protein n=1 Tax=Bacillus thuringiensis serovar vazensis TaxID=180867 RepID=A0A243D1Z4_BACTU|nr:hypothetical protein [Bacillus thuringiensis]EEM91482.1 hypothetical protein bthur0012_3080 [Bacillus thuringiensis serovar pulsiensis BGSC 4CC1]OTY80059.1 hypothetical protein BK749_01605 [Bacillus thuringiensis serovar vazensis]